MLNTFSFLTTYREDISFLVQTALSPSGAEQNMSTTTRWTGHTEEGMWSALRRHLAKRAAGEAPGPCGLWKVRSNIVLQVP